MSPVMVGRAAALGHLAGLLDAAGVVAGDQPSVALVSGEAGIGKTRLVREVLDMLPAGVTTVSVSAQPGSMGRPGDALASLAVTPTEPIGGGADPMTAAFDVVAEVVRRGRTVLVVEDLHWIDSASANVVDLIAQQPWPELVVIGTYRPGELSRGAPGGELVLRLERRHAVEQVRLDRLDRPELAAMLAAIAGRPPSSAVVEALHRRSDGVPFVVEELLRSTGPRALAGDLLAAELPWSLEEAVRQQLADLDAAERTVVEALAVYGRSASFDALVHVADLEERVVLDALRALTANGVVVEVSDDAFWFNHTLVADAIEHQLLGRERRRLHERSFEAVRAAPTLDHASLAHHAIGAGRYDEVPAIARKGAPRYLEKGSTFQALRLAADALAEAPNDPELLAVATDAAWRLDFLDEALSTAQRWERIAVEPSDRVEALRFVSRIHHELGDAKAASSSRAVLEALAEGFTDPRLRGPARAGIAQLHMIAHNSAEAVQWAELALADADATGDALTAARASVERASALIGIGSREQAIAAMDDALAAARDVGDAVLLTRGINNCLELVPPHSGRGRSLRDELTEVSTRVGFDKLGPSVGLLWEIEAAIGDGDLAAVRQLSAEGAQWWGSRGDEKAWVVAARTSFALEEGRVPDARAVLDRLCQSCADKKSYHRPMILRLRVAAAAGDRSAAEAAFGELVASSPLLDTTFALDEVLDVVETALAAGIAPARVRSELFGLWLADHPSAAAMAEHVEGLLLAAEGRPAAAAEVLARVLIEPDGRLSKPMVGSLRTALAVARIAAGDRAGALDAVRLVLDDDLARWPGVRRDRAEALARRLDGAAHRSDGELTGRELEVAALLADGLTNGQLAERLFISPKTAAVHVSNILAKLGLSSRAEIAAWAVRHGIAVAA
jgi:DNA-binding NarL/FixJ family response regulator